MLLGVGTLYPVTHSFVNCLNVSFSGLFTSVTKERVLISITRYLEVSVRFLFLLVPEIDF